MKRCLGLLIVAAGLSGTAYAQGAMVNGGSGATNSGGAAGGGGLQKPSFPALTPIPATRFAVAAYSGPEASFTPSAFVSYDQAIAEGRTVTDAQKKSLPEAAADLKNTPHAKAKVSFVQDNSGKVIIVR